MTLEEIQTLWDKDSKIDILELGNEAIKISSLHSKYYKILIQERLLLKKYFNEMTSLKAKKFQFFTNGHDEETRDLGWELPPQGKILRADAQMFVEADPDIQKQTLKIAIQTEKVEMVDSIIKSLNARGYNIKTAFDYIRFNAGG